MIYGEKNFPRAKVYSLLEPGPVVLVTTARDGRANIMAMSWHTMMEFEPPLIGCVISDRNHNQGKGTFMVAGDRIKLKSTMK